MEGDKLGRKGQGEVRDGRFLSQKKENLNNKMLELTKGINILTNTLYLVQYTG